MPLSKFKGTGVAIVTPFHKYGTVDFTSFGKIIEHVIEGGVDYIVVLGTTGESATLTKDEKLAVVDFLLEQVNGRVPVVLGIGGNNTQEIVDTVKSTNFDGIDAILSVSPYYNKPQQKGILYHYKTIANASPVGVIMYNVPSRTGSNILPETVLTLAEEDENIIGIKEASGNLEQCMEIIRNKPKDFLVISGDDLLTLPFLSLGGDGVISVVANGYPAKFSEMVRLGLKGKYKKSLEIHYSLMEIIQTLFVDGNPSGIKAVLDIMGLCKNNVRLPVVKVNKGVYFQLQGLVEKYQSVLENA
jgi:4-hydroxy-tetrahydrodipicolinate synthase